MSTVRATNFQNAGSASVNMTLDTAGNATVANTLAMGSSFLRNRIINGAMVIDQRNAGASITPASGATFTLDRWALNSTQASKLSFQQNAASVAPPAGFANYLGATSLSAYAMSAGDSFSVQQVIEGYNVADFNWGSANAVPATLSFWVRSSLTGTFGGSIATTKTAVWVMPFTYTISSANTWTYTSVSVTAPTSTGGTNNDNTAGIYVRFGLGSEGAAAGGTAGTWTNAGNYIQPTGGVSVVGTNGATWYITGVQLEAGTVATPFERRQYGQELSLCQRYYANVVAGDCVGSFWSATTAFLSQKLPTTMRTAPTISFPSAPYTNAIDQVGIGGRTPTTLTVLGVTADTLPFYGTGMSGATLGNPARWTGGTIQASAEI